MVMDPDEVCFAAGTDQAVNTPADVAIGDFDNDMDLDIVAVGGTSITFFEGSDDGSFLAGAGFSAGNGARRILASDLNLDGRDDVVLANATDNEVGIILADMALTFGTHTGYAVGMTPVDIDTLDISDDTYPDIIVGNSGDANYHTLLNDQAGGIMTTFGPHSTGMAVTAVEGVGLGAFGGSAPLDGFFCGAGNYAVVQGTDDGDINDSVTPGGSIGTSLGRAVTRQVDGMSFWDVAVIDTGAAQVHFLLATNTAGTFIQTTIAVTAIPNAVAFGDVTGEGDVDIVAALSDDTVAVMVGDGAGGFAAPEYMAVGSNPSGVAVGDLNGDNVEDIAVSNRDGNDVSLYLSTL